MTHLLRSAPWLVVLAALALRPATAEERAPFRVELDAALVALRVEDADGDGLDDLITLDAQRTLSVWRGQRDAGHAVGRNRGDLPRRRGGQHGHHGRHQRAAGAQG